MEFENGYKNIFGLSAVLELKVENNSDFQSHFSMSKIVGIFLIFFSLKNPKMRPTFIIGIFVPIWEAKHI